MERNTHKAVSIDDLEDIIAIGNDPNKVIDEANASGRKYIFMWIPDPNITYIF